MNEPSRLHLFFEFDRSTLVDADKDGWWECRLLTFTGEPPRMLELREDGVVLVEHPPGPDAETMPIKVYRLIDGEIVVSEEE